MDVLVLAVGYGCIPFLLAFKTLCCSQSPTSQKLNLILSKHSIVLRCPMWANSERDMVQKDCIYRSIKHESTKLLSTFSMFFLAENLSSFQKSSS
jgi:hypothetical protein